MLLGIMVGVSEKVIVLSKQFSRSFVILGLDMQIDGRPDRVRINSENSVLGLKVGQYTIP
jgi:hypothetical protein